MRLFCNSPFFLRSLLAEIFFEFYPFLLGDIGRMKGQGRKLPVPFLNSFLIGNLLGNSFLQRSGCDIGRSTYEKYENGELNIRVSVLIALKKIYNCAYDEFFAGLED